MIHCLVAEIKAYAEETRTRAMVAYVMISGFNVGLEDAEALRDVFDGVPVMRPVAALIERPAGRPVAP